MELITLAQEIKPDFVTIKKSGATLNRYYMESRYFPVTSDAYSIEDAEKAIETMLALVEFIKKKLE